MIKKINNLAVKLTAGLVLAVAVSPAAASALTAPDMPTNPQQTTSVQQTSSNPQLAAATIASAQSDIQCGINEAAGGDCSASSNPSGDLGTTIKKVLNIISAFAGVIAVIMIMVAGLRMVTSAGNEEGVKKAKGTIIYAVVGLVIVAVAQIIVHFVISNATLDSNTSGNSGNNTKSSSSSSSSGGLTGSPTNTQSSGASGGLRGKQVQN